MTQSHDRSGRRRGAGSESGCGDCRRASRRRPSCASSSALAAYPDRPIKIVVANTPGGPSDIIARMHGGRDAAGAGRLGVRREQGRRRRQHRLRLCARSEPDGYTILLTTSAYVVNPGLYNSIPYDPFKDFVAICEPVVTPHVFAVQADLPAKTMKEFVALVKKDPDKFNVSTPPIGTTPQLQAEVLKLREGIQKMATVVFNGGGDAVKAVLAGTVQLPPARSRRRCRISRPARCKGAGADRRQALRRAARRADHGRAGLQGLRVRHLLRADGAGQGAAGNRRQAGKGLPRHPGQAGHEEEAGRRRASTSPPRTARATRRGSPRKSRCSRRSSRTPGSRSSKRAGQGWLDGLANSAVPPCLSTGVT